jgi:hypothetical protein
MTTTRIAPARRRPITLRKDNLMSHIELRLAAILDRQAAERDRAAAERLAHRPGRNIRLRIGESLMRLGRRIAGEAAPPRRGRDDHAASAPRVPVRRVRAPTLKGIFRWLSSSRPS